MSKPQEQQRAFVLCWCSINKQQCLYGEVRGVNTLCVVHEEWWDSGEGKLCFRADSPLFTGEDNIHGNTAPSDFVKEPKQLIMQYLGYSIGQCLKDVTQDSGCHLIHHLIFTALSFTKQQLNFCQKCLAGFYSLFFLFLYFSQVIHIMSHRKISDVIFSPTWLLSLPYFNFMTAFNFSHD